MSLKNVLSRFPAGSKFRGLIRSLASQDASRRERAYEQAGDLDPFSHWREARTPSWFVSEAEALAILQAVEEFDFPLPPGKYGKDGLAEILTILWRSPYPSLVKAVPRAYPKTPDASRRCALLALLGTIATREAAETFMGCVREHGWPDEVYRRVPEELEKLFAFGDVMLPDVVLTAGKLATDVVDALLQAMSDGVLKTDEVADRLAALAPFTLRLLKKSLKSTAKHQDKPGISWRFTERYQSVRERICMLLDLSGRLKDPELTPLVREAVRFKDPRIVTFAALSLIRRGETVSKSALNTSAASHETRALLFDGLRAMKAEQRFPQKWRTWEAFGAANMVNWLLYPTELGREPDDLVLAHTEWLDKRRKLAAYVWKFRVKNRAWMAGVSGPHTLRGKPQPVEGSLTFSRFDTWDSASAEEHLKRCAGTAEEILAGDG